jgi:hypothetical protein
MSKCGTFSNFFSLQSNLQIAKKGLVSQQKANHSRQQKPRSAAIKNAANILRITEATYREIKTPADHFS